MAACGQAIAHLLHWMHSFSSQTGMSWAIARFSHFVVPVGQVPSGGKALTGSRSPLPAIITAVTCLTKSGAWSGTILGSVRDDGTYSPADAGTLTSCRFASDWSIAAKFFLT